MPYNYGLCLKAARCGSREARGTWEAALYHRVPPYSQSLLHAFLMVVVGKGETPKNLEIYGLMKTLGFDPLIRNRSVYIL